MTVSRRALGGEIKAIQATDGKPRVGGYIVRFTAPDDKDLVGEYFTAETDFMLDRGYPVKGDRVLLEHGLDSKVNAVPIGVFDFVSVDEIGIWAEALLKDEQDYEEMLREMGRVKNIAIPEPVIKQQAQLAFYAIKTYFATGSNRWSSGALPQTVEVAEDGRILSWGIIEASPTKRPAEPDGTDITVTNLKTFVDALTLREDAHPIEASADTQGDQVTASTANSTHRITKTSKGKVKMELTPEQIAAMQEQTQPAAPPEDKASKMDDLLKALRAKADELMQLLSEYVDTGGTPTEQEEMAARAAMQDEMGKGVAAYPDAKSLSANMTTIVGNMRRAAVKSVLESRKSAREAEIKAIQAEVNAMKSAPGQSAVGGGVSQQAPSIQVYDRRYAHLSAEDMAVGFKYLEALQPSTPFSAARKMGDIASPDYLRHMVGKIGEQLERSPIKRGHEAAFLKHVMPVKANELNASDIAGQGTEWLGVYYDTRVWETARNQYIYEQMQRRGMQEKEVPQGAASAKVAIEGNDPTVYGGGEANSLGTDGRPETVFRPVPIATTTIDVSPGTFRVATAFTRILTEDSFIDMAQESNRKIELALRENIEKAMLLGDTTTTASTNINNIDGTPTASGLTRDYFLEFDGLIKSPLVTSTAYSRSASGSLTIDDYINTLNLLPDEQKARKENLFFVIDVPTQFASMRLPQIITRDVAGEDATIFTGNLPALWGIPIFASGFLGKVNTAGKKAVTTPANNTTGRILLVYPEYWAFTFKRNITIETERIPSAESDAIYASMRFSLTRRSASAAAITYNVGV